MDWNIIHEHVGKFAYFMRGDMKIKIIIDNAHTYENGDKWVTYTFITHTELSPLFFGTNTISANFICEPIKYRSITSLVI
jgi:hypothetical protein